MTIILTLDDKNGISFNNRRQSRDKIVVERILQFDPNVKIDEYSKSIFPENHISSSDDFYFIENRQPDLSSADQLIVFRWNRVYPSDIKVDLSGWKLISSEGFDGSSHKITMEEYSK